MTLTTRKAESKATLSCFCSSPFSQHEALTADHHQLERFLRVFRRQILGLTA